MWLHFPFIYVIVFLNFGWPVPGTWQGLSSLFWIRSVNLVCERQCPWGRAGERPPEANVFEARDLNFPGWDYLVTSAATVDQYKWPSQQNPPLWKEAVSRSQEWAIGRGWEPSCSPAPNPPAQIPGQGWAWRTLGAAAPEPGGSLRQVPLPLSWSWEQLPGPCECGSHTHPLVC